MDVELQLADGVVEGKCQCLSCMIVGWMDGLFHDVG